MKKIILFFVLSIFLNASTITNILEDIAVKTIEETLTSNNKSEIIHIHNNFIKKFINNKNCDKILSNNGYFLTCYNYNLKSSIFGYSKINGELINKNNIEKRPRFYIDKEIPKQYQSHYSDYTNSGFDRGHNFHANDASFDYDQRSLNSTYVMSNITPQYPNTNRHNQLSIERYQRLIASKLDFIETLTKINFTNSPKRIGKNQIAVPNSFSFMLWNEDKNFQKCFHLPNDNILYKLKEMEINCNKIF